MLAASMLALHLHKPLTDVDNLLKGQLLGSGRRLTDETDLDVLSTARRILIVDDSLHTGRSMRAAQAKAEGHPLIGRLLWGAVYLPHSSSQHPVDVWHSVVPMPRAFEWNVLHHSRLGDACMDIDGVLCRDPSVDENDDGPTYERFLCEVPARLVPGSEVGWLVTSRLERYRRQTETWLAAQGIRYRHLIMHSAETAEQRRLAGDHAFSKARAYRDTGAWLFIESDVRQAQEIARLSRRSVYCTDARTMVYPDMPVGAGPRRRHQEVWRMRTRATRFRRRAKRAAKRLLTGAR
jgi:orotate phosphoribosyltransferase